MATHHATVHDLLRECREMYEGSNSDGKLSDWEKSFLGDQIARTDQYGDDIRISPKQQGVLERIYGKLAGVKIS